MQVTFAVTPVGNKADPDILTPYNSLSMGMFERMIELVFTKGFEVYIYIWVYNNYAVVDLSPDSLWLWIVTFLGVDFGYYCK